jgi:hypothetical protein
VGTHARAHSTPRDDIQYTKFSAFQNQLRAADDIMNEANGH